MRARKQSGKKAQQWCFFLWSFLSFLPWCFLFFLSFFPFLWCFLSFFPCLWCLTSSSVSASKVTPWDDFSYGWANIPFCIHSGVSGSMWDSAVSTSWSSYSASWPLMISMNFLIWDSVWKSSSLSRSSSSSKSNSSSCSNFLEWCFLWWNFSVLLKEENYLSPTCFLTVAMESLM